MHKAIDQVIDDDGLSVSVVKQLIMRGANHDTTTDQGESCYDLIPDNLPEEVTENVHYLFKKHKCTCQFTMTFRFLPIKHKRSPWTLIVFTFFCLLMFLTNLLFVLPNLPEGIVFYILDALHYLLWLSVALVLITTICKNPGILKKHEVDEDLDIVNLLKKFHPDDMCPRCNVLTTPRSQHCNICEVCVEGWDHHCPWLNNCVGS